VVVGVCLLPFGAAATGYLGYSDRPGPGWYGSGWSGIDPRHARFVAAFGGMLSPFAFATAGLLYSLVRLLVWLRFSAVTVVAVSMISSAVMSGLIVLGVGWYIAVGEDAVLYAAGAGALVGAIVLPARRMYRYPTRLGLPGRPASFGSAGRAIGRLAVSLALIPIGLLPLLALLVAFGPRGPVLWLVPETYRGWVAYRFDTPNCPPAEMEGLFLVLRADASGCGCTSGPVQDGMRIDRYSVAGADGSRRSLEETPAGSGGEIWGVERFSEAVANERPQGVRRFFVGQEAEYGDHGARQTSFDRARHWFAGR
jgi:hypothetical protein